MGEPIYPDKATEERRHIDYTRVCVKVSCIDELPEVRGSGGRRRLPIYYYSGVSMEAPEMYNL